MRAHLQGTACRKVEGEGNKKVSLRQAASSLQEFNNILTEFKKLSIFSYVSHKN